MTSTWVYGVVPAGAELNALDQRREELPELWIVESDDLAAIVGAMPEDDEKGTRDRALAHSQVLELAAADATVVPMRFGSVADGEDDLVVSGLLEPRHDELVSLLERLDGKIQLALKVTYDEDAVMREILAREPEIAQLREAAREGNGDAGEDARVRLGEMVSLAIEQRRARDSADIVERLDPAALAMAPGPLESEFMVLSAAFLVARDRQDEFESAVEEVAGESAQRMHYRLLGPMPAYDFIEAGTPA